MKFITIFTLSVSVLFTSCSKDEPLKVNNNPTSSNSQSNTPSIECDISWNNSVTYNSVSDIEGNTYKTVTIGSQEWMAENLKATKFNDGSDIIEISNEIEWENNVSEIPAYCIYTETDSIGQEVSYVDCEGLLYNRYVVIDNKNVCPIGWSIPTESDWDNLKGFINNIGYDNGSALKSLEGWSTPTYNGNGFDPYGFRTVPTGWRSNINTAFSKRGTQSFMWVSDKDSLMQLLYDSNFMHYIVGSGSGSSIRCIKD